MNSFEIIILDLIVLIFPLLIYLVYSVYTKTLDVKKSNLYLDCALFSSYYLLLKIGVLNIKNLPLLLIDVLLIIAYLKNRKVSYIFLSVAFIFYYYNLFNTWFLIGEYIIYFILYLLLKNKNQFIFTNLFIAIKVIMFTIYFSNKYCFDLNSLFYIVLLFVITTNFVIYLYAYIDNMFSLYKQVKNIDKERKIQESLFKITHEIKNPIAVCKGYLDMFDINNIDHSKKYIPIMKSEIDRVLALLQDFLSITRIKIEKEEMDLTMLLEDTIICLKPLLNKKNVKLIADIDEDEIYINADYNRLKQSLVNIIKNSLESINNKGKIKISTNVDKNKIKIIIEDNGIGMDNEELNKIKQAFFTTKSNGTGLGIYLSNEIISSHNGTLEYNSKKNIGTKVTISLPVN